MGSVTAAEDQGTSGRLFWWSGASSYTLMTADLDGVVQWRLGARCAVMDSHSWRQLSGVMVASMAEWPDKVEASISALKTDLWKMAATTHVSASDQFMPQTRYVARLGLLAFDDRLR